MTIVSWTHILSWVKVVEKQATGKTFMDKKSWSERNPMVYAVLEASVFGLTVWSLVSVIWVMNTYNVTPLT